MQDQKQNLHFTPIIKKTIELYKKHFTIISGFMMIPAVFVLIMEYFFPSDPTVGYQTFYSYSAETVNSETTGIALLVGVVGMVVSYLAYAASLRHISTEGKVGFSEALQQVTGTVREAIILAIKLFIYTYAWIIIAIAAAIMIVTAMGGAAVALVPVLAIATLVVILILIKRLISVTFAFPLFLTEEGMTPDQALNKTLKITKGNLVTIFVNYFLLGVIGGLAAYVYGLVAFPLINSFATSPSSYNMGVTALYLPLDVIFGGISVLFTYVFMLKALGK